MGLFKKLREEGRTCVCVCVCVCVRARAHRNVCLNGCPLGGRRGAGTRLRVAPAWCALRAWVLRAWGRGESLRVC